MRGRGDISGPWKTNREEGDSRTKEGDIEGRQGEAEGDAWHYSFLSAVVLAAAHWSPNGYIYQAAV